MRFITFEKDGMSRAGVLRGDGGASHDRIYDLSHSAMRSALGGLPPQTLDFVRKGLSSVAAEIDAHGLREDAALTVADVTLLAPLPRPNRIFGAAHNFTCAIAERGIAPPPEPVLFEKAVDTVVGPGAPVMLPPDIGGVTYEAELAVIIGAGGSNIPAETALSHICAYSIINDISASDMIRTDGHFNRGKNLPTFCPFGPFMATADEIANPQGLRVSFEMDAQMLQDGTTANMIFSIADLIAALSADKPLEAGDVIATGTPAGVAAMRSPQSWLYPGASMTAAVEQLGALTNPVLEGQRYHG